MNLQFVLTVRQLIRTRPLAIEVLEEVAGHRCWLHLDDLVSKFCDLLDLDAESLMDRTLSMPPAAGWDGERAHLYCLVDHLTQQHHRFRSLHLQTLQLQLDAPELHAAPLARVFAPIRQEFHSFNQDFLWHMEEEETFLFPKILRTEACVRHRELYPEVYSGSINMYSADQIHSPEYIFRHMLESLVVRVRALVEAKFPAPRIGLMLRTLKLFRTALIEHAALESDILFPRARKLEELLSKRKADSAPQSMTLK